MPNIHELGTALTQHLSDDKILTTASHAAQEILQTAGVFASLTDNSSNWQTNDVLSRMTDAIVNLAEAQSSTELLRRGISDYLGNIGFAGAVRPPESDEACTTQRQVVHPNFFDYLCGKISEADAPSYAHLKLAAEYFPGLIENGHIREPNGTLEQYRPIYQKLIAGLRPADCKRLLLRLHDFSVYGNKASSGWRTVTPLMIMTANTPELREPALNSLGLGTKGLPYAWDIGYKHADYRENETTFEEYCGQNLDTILAIESHVPDGSVLLRDKFLIRNFARVDIATLIRQARTADDSDVPYGLVGFGVSDPTGAHRAAKTEMDWFRQKLNSANIELRVCEINSQREAALISARMLRFYGEKEALFCIARFHGEYWGVQLGGEEGSRQKRHYIRISDLSNGIGSALDFLGTNAQIVFASCCVNGKVKDGGLNFIQALSQETSRRPSGPTKPFILQGFNLGRAEDGSLNVSLRGVYDD